MKQLIFFSLSIIVGCTYGYDTMIRVTPISGNSYSAKTVDPEIYFEDPNLKISKPYEQISFIEVQGAAYARTDDLLKEMKLNAAKVGADAVINVKQNYITRERGVITIPSSNQPENKPEKYSTISLTGIAIKYK